MIFQQCSGSHRSFIDAQVSRAPTPGSPSVGQKVGRWVGHTFRFPLCRRLWTITEHPWTTGRHRFSDSIQIFIGGSKNAVGRGGVKQFKIYFLKWSNLAGKKSKQKLGPTLFLQFGANVFVQLFVYACLSLWEGGKNSMKKTTPWSFSRPTL